MVAENRFVAAALLPSIVYKEPEFETKLVHERASLYKETEQDPLKLSSMDERRKQIIDKIKNYDQKKKE